MSDPYKVGIAIALSSNATQIFGALGQHFLKLDKHLTSFQNNWKKTALLIGGGLGALGAVTVLKNAEKLIDRGNHLIKIQRDMAQAGATNVQVQEAYSKAWELTSKYQNIGAVDALKLMNDARAIYGSQDTATHEIEPMVRMASFLRAYQGAEKGSATHDSIMREAQAAMKSGEISGNITPDDMKKHADNLVAMKVYFGDQVSIARYLQAQRAAGVSYLTSGDEFRYGMFPALVQEFGPGAGVMQQTLWAKTVAGVMNRTSSLQAMDQYGLLKDGEVKYDKVGQAIGLKHGGESIVGSSVAAENYPKWVMETLIPSVIKKRGFAPDADGHYSKKDLSEIASIVGQFFPDRNAMKAVMEAFVQYPKLLKDQAGLLAVHRDLEKYTTGSWDYQKQAFTTQWNSFLEAMGAPMVEKATQRLAALNSVLVGWGQWAANKDNADTVRVIGDAIQYFGLALGAGAAVAIMSAIGPAGWLIGGLAALAVALTDPRFREWTKGYDISQWLDRNLIEPLINWLRGSHPSINAAIDAWFNSNILEPISSWLSSHSISNWFKGFFGGDGRDIGEGKGTLKPDPSGQGLLHLQRFVPGERPQRPQPLSLSLNIDGRTLAQTVAEIQSNLYEFPGSAPSPNGLTAWNDGDHNFATT